MITNYFKLYIKCLFLIIFLNSCENKSISEFDKNIEELITWSLLEKNDYQNVNYTPISSKTLAGLLTLQEHKNIIQPENGILIGYFSFQSNKMFINDSDKDLLILISKAQKYENFDILIQSNDIKSNLNDIVDEIITILSSNGVNSSNIKLNSIADKNLDFAIRIIKLL